MQDEHRVAVIELRALQSSAARVQDLVLKGSDEASSLAASLSSAADLIEGRVQAAAANGVHWGARLALITALLHFPKLEPKLELLGSGRNVDLTKSQLDALCTRMRQASESLSLSVLPSDTRNSPNDAGKV
jgi:hypothetical protein